jgi:tRNA pseudouridine38-40 synthase
VIKAEWTQTGEGQWLFEVQADAFLYRMVRRMVFLQVAVAQGKVSVEAIAYSFVKQETAEFRNRLVPGMAPAHGLTLVNVEYKM